MDTSLRWYDGVLHSLLAILLLAACSHPAEDAKPAEPIAEVRTVAAESGMAVSTLTVYGAAEADLAGSASLTSQREAVLASISAPNGTQVQAGQVVATLRASPLSQLDGVKVANDVRVADAALSRAMRLRGDGLASNADVDAARAAATAANATRTSVRTSQHGLTLRAPTRGIVQNITLRPGDVVAAGTTVATVAASGHLRGRFGVDPLALQAIHAGQPIHIAQVNGSAPLDAAISGIDTQADATTKFAALFARLPASYTAAPGVPLKATVAVGSTTSGTLIPYAALLDDGGKAFVFTIEAGVAHRKTVTVGSSAGDRISVAGVALGAHVVTEGGTALEDGMKVREKAAGQ